jgi:Escherichia/Staphylococcus phage prohead protease
MEVRKLVSRAEIRADEAKFQLVGTAVAYNTLSANDVPYPGWNEKIAPGAFRATLSAANADVKALWSHDASKILGRQKNSTLQLQDTPSGLRYVLQLDRTSQMHRDCFASVQRRDVDALSFAFICNGEDEDQQAKVRTVTSAELIEISFVTFPAYPKGTSAEARAAAMNNTHGVLLAVEYLRKAAQSVVRALFRDMDSSPVDFASHLARCHESTELSCMYAQRCREAMGDDEDVDPDDEVLRAHLRMAESGCKLASEYFAQARLRHQRNLSKLQQAKALGRGR